MSMNRRQIVKKETVKVKIPKNYWSSGGSCGRIQISLDKKTCGGYKLKYPLCYVKIILNCLMPDDQRIRTSLHNMNGKFRYLSITGPAVWILPITSCNSKVVGREPHNFGVNSSVFKKDKSKTEAKTNS